VWPGVLLGRPLPHNRRGTRPTPLGQHPVSNDCHEESWPLRRMGGQIAGHERVRIQYDPFHTASGNMHWSMVV